MTRRVVVFAGLVLALGFLVSAQQVTLVESTVVSLYRGTSKFSDQPSWDACLARARELAKADTRTTGTVTYSCKTEVRKVVANYAPAPVPVPVDCVVSAWTLSVATAWSTCTDGLQTRTETWTRTILTQPANGGLACPALTETRTGTQACTVTPPPPQPSSPDPILLDDFEQSTMRVTNPTDSDPAFRTLWSVFTDTSRGGAPQAVPTLSTDQAVSGVKSLKVTATGPGGSDPSILYVQLQPYYQNAGGWQFMHQQIVAGTWKLGTFNRARIRIKIPNVPGVAGLSRSGGFNFNIGTYLADPDDGQRVGGETNNNHYYHFYNLPVLGTWHELIWDTHPNHLRGNSGSTELGDRQASPLGQAGWWYHDHVTRFYMQMAGTAASYPVSTYIDAITFFTAPPDENIQQVYGLNWTYQPSTNYLYVGWMRRKEQESTNHEVRYAFSSIRALGWNNATPWGTVSPMGSSGYNSMFIESNTLPLVGQTEVFVGIRPVGATTFREVRIALP